MDYLFEQIEPYSIDRLWSEEVGTYRLDALKIYVADEAWSVLDNDAATVFLRSYGPSQSPSPVSPATADIRQAVNPSYW